LNLKFYTPNYLTIFHNNSYINVDSYDNGKKIHITKISKDEVKTKHKLTIFNKKDLIENSFQAKLFKEDYIDKLSNSNITFENIVSREIFLSAIF
jgi:acetylglutamate synthase